MPEVPGMRWFEILQVTEEATDCCSYLLQSPDGSGFAFLPGQFLTFLLEIGAQQERRAYSVSGSYENGTKLRITVKKLDNGLVSRHILSHWKAGMKVQAIGPAGRFVLPEKIIPSAHFVFIAAGSGIAPVFALMQALIERRSAVSVLLISQFRFDREIIFREELETWKRTVPQFEWISFISRDERRPVSARRLTNEKLGELLGADPGFSANAGVYFICGPLRFMRMAAFTLREMGVPEDNIRREKFDPPREPISWIQPDTKTHEITLVDGKNKTVFPVSFPDSLLEGAAKAGISIPFSCKAGICSTCIMRCLSGKVVMRFNEVLTDADLRDGLVLTCVGYALTTVSLESPI